MEEKNKDVVDIGRILRLLWSRWRLFLIVWVVTFIVSCLWILPQPRQYTSHVVLIPEKVSENAAGGIASLASSFGFNIGGSEDAIYPLLYPDIISSNDFIIGLFDIPVRSLDGEIACDYYTYMDKYQEVAFYAVPFLRMQQFFRSAFGEREPDVATFSDAGTLVNGVNPFLLSRRQTAIIKLMEKSIGCSVDKKTEVITISVRAQDKLICATLADSVVSRLQAFIIDYRTGKARQDLDYYTSLTHEAKVAYETARRTYSDYADSHADLSLPSYQAQLDDLENEMQLRYNTYTGMNTQREMALAKVQERTPSFTTMESATVPIKASEPKRMLFCITMLFLATLATILYLLVKDKEGASGTVEASPAVVTSSPLPPATSANNEE